MQTVIHPHDPRATVSQNKFHRAIAKSLDGYIIFF